MKHGESQCYGVGSSKVAETQTLIDGFAYYPSLPSCRGKPLHSFNLM